MVDQAVLEIPNTVENKYPEAVCMMAGLLEDIFGVSALLKAFMKTDKANARLLFTAREVQSLKSMRVQKKIHG